MQEHEVIDVPDVVLGAQLVLCELVQGVEVDVGEELRRQVTDRQAQARWLCYQALVLRHPIEQVRRTAGLVIFARVVHEDLRGEGQPPGFGNPGLQLLAQHCLIDGDEEVGQVALQVEDRLRPVFAGAAYLLFKPGGGVQRAAPWNACATVRYEAGLKARGHMVVHEVVDDAVPKGCRPNLSGFRPGDHETNGSAWPVSAGNQVVVQLQQVDLHVLLEQPGARGIPLAAPAVVVSLDEILELEGSNT